MTGPRIFIIVLVLLGVLFIVGLGMGLRQNDAQPNANNVSPPNWTSTLGDWLSPSLDLTTVQLTAGACLQAAQKSFTLAAGSDCQLQVPAANKKYRKLKLHLVTGASVKVNYTAPTNTDPNLSKQDLSWPGKDPQTLLVLAGGGSIVLSCGKGTSCLLETQ